TAGRVPVEASLNIRTERAPLGLVARINIELEASELAEAVVVQVAVAVDPVGIVVVHLVAHVATDAQAGLGARDVEETSAVHVADANVFHRLRLGDDDRISCASTGCSDSSHCGAEKQALDVHFLTSSQKLKSG